MSGVGPVSRDGIRVGRRSERIGIVSLLLATHEAEACSHWLQPVVWVAFGMMRPDWARVTRFRWNRPRQRLVRAQRSLTEISGG